MPHGGGKHSCHRVIKRNCVSAHIQARACRWDPTGVVSDEDAVVEPKLGRARAAAHGSAQRIPRARPCPVEEEEGEGERRKETQSRLKKIKKIINVKACLRACVVHGRVEACVSREGKEETRAPTCANAYGSRMDGKRKVRKAVERRWKRTEQYGELGERDRGKRG